MKLPDIVILAGGKGTRLRSVITDLPKPMAPVAGKPFLHYLLEFLKSKGAQRIVLATGYMHEAIESHFGNDFNGIELEYSIEKEPLGTGGAIKLAVSKCKTKEVLVYNGDTLFLAHPELLVNFKKETNADISIFLKPMNHPERYGTVDMEGDYIVSFEEKNANIESGLINAGVYCINAELLNSFEANVFSFEQDVLEPYSALKRISGLPSDAYFIDIGIPEDYAKANKRFGTLEY